MFDPSKTHWSSWDRESTRSIRTAAIFNRVSAPSGIRPARAIVVRGGYAVMINQTNTGYVGGSTSNPPLATPLNVSGNVKLDWALATAQASGLAPTTTNPDFQPARMQTWNVNVEKELAQTGVMVGYFGSHGDRLRIPININQLDQQRAAVPDAVGDEPDRTGRDTG